VGAIEPVVEQVDVAPAAQATAAPPPPVRTREWLYFARRNRKAVIGFAVVVLSLLLALVGPWLTDADPFEFGYGTGLAPSSDHWLGTTAPGQDVFAQLVHGLRASFVVGCLSAVIASLIGMTVGFVAGYRGGVVDEVLSMLTNVVLVIPTLAVLIIVAAYLSVRGLVTEAILIGVTSWPWAARAIRAQTFSLASRDFISLARLSGARGGSVIVREIAPNMASYLFLVFILLFGGSILTAAFLDFLGLGPTNAMSLGVMMNNAVVSGALPLGMWWWFVPPGLAITAVVGGLYVMNVGLDEIFNPRLRRL
jgi:peptide/nickel transport system permease protein